MCVGKKEFRYKLEFVSHLEQCVKSIHSIRERFNLLKKAYIFTEVRQKSWVEKPLSAKQDPIGTFQKDTITKIFPTASAV